MGLGFNVEGYECKARWSYGGFHAFRNKLAKSIGIDLEEMDGHLKKHPTDMGYYKPGNKSWKEVKSSIKDLLNHSDCQGNLTPEQCNIIFPTLRQILNLWETTVENQYDIEQGNYLADAMEYCALNNKDLNFC